MRRPLVTLDGHAVVQNARLQISADQPQYGFVLNTFTQAMHQHIVIDPIKEPLKVHIHDHPVAFLHVTLCGKHCIMRASARTKAVAVFRERRIKYRLQNLQQGLLDQPIGHRRYPKLPCPATGLRYLHPANRLWPITSCEQFRPYPRPVSPEMLNGVGDRQTIHSRTAFVGFDSFPSHQQVLSCERLFKQTRSA